MGNENISLHFDNDALSAIISLFATLKNVESDNHISLSQNGREIEVKKIPNQNVVKFNFNLSSITFFSNPA